MQRQKATPPSFPFAVDSTLQFGNKSLLTLYLGSNGKGHLSCKITAKPESIICILKYWVTAPLFLKTAPFLFSVGVIVTASETSAQTQETPAWTRVTAKMDSTPSLAFASRVSVGTDAKTSLTHATPGAGAILRPCVLMAVAASIVRRMKTVAKPGRTAWAVAWTMNANASQGLEEFIVRQVGDK